MPPKEYIIINCEKIGDNLYVWEQVDIGSHIESQEEKLEQVFE